MPEPAAPAPILDARGLAVRGRRDVVLSGLDLTLPPGGTAALVGPPGSGRTSALLALSGRMKRAEGRLSVAGSTDPAEIRRLGSVARAEGTAELDHERRVDEVATERAILARTVDGPARLGELLPSVGLGVHSRAYIGELSADARTRLQIALALMDDPAVIVLDDLDRGIPVAGQVELWRVLVQLDVGVVASTVEPAALLELPVVVCPLAGDSALSTPGGPDVTTPPTGDLS